MDQLEKLFSAHSLRLTRPRRAVFCTLRKADKPLALSDIVASSRGSDRSSVYRTLLLFEELGIITILHLGWKKRYELAGPFKPHHHHLECTQCGELVAIDTPRFEELVQSTARAYRYHLTSHHIELRGLCGRCTKSK